jgi:hypothetical protein
VPTPTLRRGLTAAAALAVLATACSAGGDDAATDTAELDRSTVSAPGTEDAVPEPVDEAPAHHDVEGGAAGGDDGDAAAGDDVTSVADRAARGREVARTAAITLELDDPEASVARITAVAEDLDGYVATADLRRDERTGDLGGTMTLRVPSPALVRALDDLEGLAEEAPERRIDEQDVTTEAVDLRARVRNLGAYEQELVALLGEVREDTSDPDLLLPVFERVQSVRSELDRLDAQLDALEDRVALSTITVTLRPTAGSTPVPTSAWAPLRTVEAALAATGRALAGVVDAVIWIVVTVLPVTVVVLGPPALLAWAWLRRRTRGASTADAPTTG